MAFVGICKIPVYLEKSIEANRNYLKQISYFTTKGTVSLSLSEKYAFIGNLVASFSKNASRT
jgi:hypothetical protein